jgi:hypothetical protein
MRSERFKTQRGEDRVLVRQVPLRVELIGRRMTSSVAATVHEADRYCQM